MSAEPMAEDNTVISVACILAGCDLSELGASRRGVYIAEARDVLDAPEVARWRSAAARLRSLAALFDQPLNRDQEHTFTGHALAEMLRGEG